MGLRSGDWFRCLLENRFQLDSPFLLRAGAISLMSLMNSLTSAVDRVYFRKRLKACQVRPPVFILGHWRTGTTHLHHLLSLDRRFVTPNLVQTLFPSSFLLIEPMLKSIISPFLPETRLIDNMRFSADAPQEDEFAVAAMCMISPYLAYSFPRRWDHYDRYISLENATASELLAWTRSLQSFVSRLVLKNGKTALLKSPLHTARIKHLLAIYPQAKFIHISRNPYEVFQSTRHMMSIGPAMTQLQRFDFNTVDGIIRRRFRTITSAYLEQRALIPEGSLYELRFEDLEQHPLIQLQDAYDRLELGGFERVRPQLETYLESIRGYTKTRYPSLSDSSRELIAKDWSNYFREFDYQP